MAPWFRSSPWLGYLLHEWETAPSDRTPVPHAGMTNDGLSPLLDDNALRAWVNSTSAQVVSVPCATPKGSVGSDVGIVHHLAVCDDALVAFAGFGPRAQVVTLPLSALNGKLLPEKLDREEAAAIKVPRFADFIGCQLQDELAHLKPSNSRHVISVDDFRDFSAGLTWHPGVIRELLRASNDGKIGSRVPAWDLLTAAIRFINFQMNSGTLSAFAAEAAYYRHLCILWTIGKGLALIPGFGKANKVAAEALSTVRGRQEGWFQSALLKEAEREGRFVNMEEPDSTAAGGGATGPGSVASSSRVTRSVTRAEKSQSKGISHATRQQSKRKSPPAGDGVGRKLGAEPVRKRASRRASEKPRRVETDEGTGTRLRSVARELLKVPPNLTGAGGENVDIPAGMGAEVGAENNEPSESPTTDTTVVDEIEPKRGGRGPSGRPSPVKGSGTSQTESREQLELDDGEVGDDEGYTAGGFSGAEESGRDWSSHGEEKKDDDTTRGDRGRSSHPREIDLPNPPSRQPGDEPSDSSDDSSESSSSSDSSDESIPDDFDDPDLLDRYLKIAQLKNAMKQKQRERRKIRESRRHRRAMRKMNRSNRKAHRAHVASVELILANQRNREEKERASKSVIKSWTSQQQRLLHLLSSKGFAERHLPTLTEAAETAFKREKNLVLANNLLNTEAAKWKCKPATSGVACMFTRGFWNQNILQAVDGFSVFMFFPAANARQVSKGAQQKKERRRLLQSNFGKRQLPDEMLDELAEMEVFFPKREGVDDLLKMIQTAILFLEFYLGRGCVGAEIYRIGFTWADSNHMLFGRAVDEDTGNNFLIKYLYMLDRGFNGFARRLIEMASEDQDPLREPQQRLSNFAQDFFGRELGNLIDGGAAGNMSLPPKVGDALAKSQASTPSNTPDSRVSHQDRRPERQPAERQTTRTGGDERPKRRRLQQNPDDPWCSFRGTPDEWKVPEGKQFGDVLGKGAPMENKRGYPKITHHASGEKMEPCLRLMVGGGCKFGETCRFSHRKDVSDLSNEDKAGITARLKKVYEMAP